jgi:hypothetical protein
MGSLVAVDHNPFAGQLDPQAQPGLTLPNAPSAPSYQAVTGQPYLTNADWMNVMTDIFTNGGKNMSQILNNAPAHKGAQTYQEGLGKNAAALDERKRAGSEVIPGINELRAMISSASDADWKTAMGPYNTSQQPPSAEVPFSLGAWRSDKMTPTQARAAFAPSDANAKAWNLQNQVNHLVNALTEQYVAAAGKGGINMSDARQKVFEETMGALRGATTRQEALKILGTAENTTRNVFGLPGNDMIAKGSPTGKEIPPEAIADLKRNTSLKMRQYFDEVFGPGSSDSVLRAR